MTTAEKEKSPFIPIVVSILAGIFWAAFMLIHILFWSSNYDWLQNLAIIVLSLVWMGGVIGIMWVFWVFKRE